MDHKLVPGVVVGRSRITVALRVEAAPNLVEEPPVAEQITEEPTPVVVLLVEEVRLVKGW